MMRAATLLVLATIGLVAAQAPWKDPNAQTEGFQASLTPDNIKTSNPLGLKPAQVQRDGMGAPNAGVTFSSQHNAEVSADAVNLWSWEYDGYNVESVGLTTVHNIKHPEWPVVLTLFDSVSSPDFAPIANGELQKAELNKLGRGLADGAGKALGYKDIFAAVDASALAVVSRMAADPTQAIIGVLGNDVGESGLQGGIDMPVNDDTFIPLDDSELAELGIPPASPAPGADAPPAGPISDAPAAHGLAATLLLVLAACAAGVLAA